MNELHCKECDGYILFVEKAKNWWTVNRETLETESIVLGEITHQELPVEIGYFECADCGKKFESIKELLNIYKEEA